MDWKLDSVLRKKLLPVARLLLKYDLDLLRFIIFPRYPYFASHYWQGWDFIFIHFQNSYNFQLSCKAPYYQLKPKKKLESNPIPLVHQHSKRPSYTLRHPQGQEVINYLSKTYISTAVTFLDSYFNLVDHVMAACK